MFISILAIGPNGEFGTSETEKGKGLPFKSKVDMKWFSSVTKGNMVVMSEKSYNLIPNGLPDREVMFQTRNGLLCKRHNLLIDPSTLKDTLCFIAGGKQIYQTYMKTNNFVFISLIPSNLVCEKANLFFNIEEYLKEDYISVYSGQSRDQSESIGFIVLSKVLVVPSQKGNMRHIYDLPIELKAQISSNFEPYLKLKIKDTIIIQPQTHGVVEISTLVCVPCNQTGIFSIRQSLAEKGLYTSGTGFKEKWYGRPRIIVTNKSLNPIELRAGEEIGEISFLNNRSL